MKSVIGWVKTNLISVASIILVIASIGVIVWSMMHGGAAADEASTELNKMVRQLRGYESNTVPFPPAEVDAPPEDISGVVINPATLERLDEVYGKLTREYQAVISPIVQHNRGGHGLVVPGVLPETDANHLRHETRTRYREAFVNMLEPYDASIPDAPRLNAINPMNPAELQYQLRLVEEGFRPDGFGNAASGSMSESDRKRLRAQQTERALELLVERARSAHIYADIYPQSSGFPFQVAPWSQATGLPSYKNIWNSHMELWIQEDLVHAIALANKVSDPKMSVVDAPVKRLISISVIPGNVGTDTMGGMGVAGEVKSAGGGGGMMGGYGGGYGGMGGMGGGMGGQPEAAAAASAAGNPDQPLGVDFHTGPSGRISNAIYDVRHARVVLIVDYQQLPSLFNAISQVNFMTVLDCQVKDVDEYMALMEGYVYGPGDAVQVDLLVESLWLRDWTQQFMPSEIKTALGIADSQPETPADDG